MFISDVCLDWRLVCSLQLVTDMVRDGVRKLVYDKDRPAIIKEYLEVIRVDGK